MSLFFCHKHRDIIFVPLMTQVTQLQARVNTVRAAGMGTRTGMRRGGGGGGGGGVGKRSRFCIANKQIQEKERWRTKRER